MNFGQGLTIGFGGGGGLDMGQQMRQGRVTTFAEMDFVTRPSGVAFAAEACFGVIGRVDHLGGGR